MTIRLLKFKTLTFSQLMLNGIAFDIFTMNV